MSGIDAYYQRYWSNPAAAPPLSDPTTPRRKELLWQALQDVKPGSKVLDAGCGGGDFTDYLASLGFEALGSDLSDQALQFARARFPKRTFVLGTPETLRERFANEFAAIWSSEVIEHVVDLYGFLVSLHTCMAEQGKLVLTTPYHGLIKNILIDLFGYANHYNPFHGHIRFFDHKSLDRALRHCGFTPVFWTGYGRPYPLYKSFFVVAVKSHGPSPPPPADG